MGRGRNRLTSSVAALRGRRVLSRLRCITRDRVSPARDLCQLHAVQPVRVKQDQELVIGSGEVEER